MAHPLEAPMSSCAALKVSEHSSVDEVAEVPFEDAHGFRLAVACPARVGVELLGAWLKAQLGHGHAVQDRVDAAVRAWVAAVAERVAVALSCSRGPQRGAAWTG